MSEVTYLWLFPALFYSLNFKHRVVCAREGDIRRLSTFGCSVEGERPQGPFLDIGARASGRPFRASKLSVINHPLEERLSFHCLYREPTETRLNYRS